MAKRDYEVEVVELVATRRKYIVAASSAETAKEKAEMGRTVEEVDLDQGEVRERTVVSEPVEHLK